MGGKKEMKKIIFEIIIKSLVTALATLLFMYGFFSNDVIGVVVTLIIAFVSLCSLANAIKQYHLMKKW